jgi:uncharacterized phage protein (TIGR01671 family)
MREIKFRYTVVRVNGYIFHHDFTLHQIESPDVDRFIRVNHIGDTDSIYRRQFTGILDTNKKEIYEGDIVSVSIYGDEKPSILEVHWQYGGFFIDYEDSESDMVLVANFVGSVEVIGNIYENEDLLTEIR